MLAAFFRSNQPAALFTAPVLAAGLFLPAFWQVPAQHGDLMPLAAIVQRSVGGSAIAQAAVGLLLLLVVQVQLTALINDLELMDRRNHLAAFFFPVVLSGSGGMGLYDPALLGLPLVLWALRRAWSLTNTGAALQPLFDAGLLVGLAALCFLPYALILVAVWASVSVNRPFAWREYLLPLIAVAVTFYFAWGALYLAGSTPWLPLRTVSTADAHAADLWTGLPHRAFTIALTAMLLIALAAFNSSYARSVMRGKNLRSAFMALALTLGLIMLLLRLLKGSFPAVLAALPASVIMGYAFLNPRRPWLAELAAYALLSFALWARWS